LWTVPEGGLIRTGRDVSSNSVYLQHRQRAYITRTFSSLLVTTVQFRRFDIVLGLRNLSITFFPQSTTSKRAGESTWSVSFIWCEKWGGTYSGVHFREIKNTLPIDLEQELLPGPIQ